MENEIIMQNGVLLIVFSGDLDLKSADRYREKIDEAIVRTNAQYLVFDLSEVDFIDSSGLGMMLGRYKRIKQKGGRVALCGIHQQLDRMIEVSGLRSLMPVYESREAAMEGV